jgi:hypothetical protein
MVGGSTADAFYFEAFTQDEAFAAADTENARRKGLFTATTPGDTGAGTSCTADARKRERCDVTAAYMTGPVWNHFVRIWCREEVRPGRAKAVRKYVASSYDSMWNRTQRALTNNRHYYEIIREGSPCHIYFDLEFGTAENPRADGNMKVDCLLNIIANLVKCEPS